MAAKTNMFVLKIGNFPNGFLALIPVIVGLMGGTGLNKRVPNHIGCEIKLPDTGI